MGDYFGYTPAGEYDSTSYGTSGAGGAFSTSYTPASTFGGATYGGNTYGNTTEEVITTTNTYTTPVTNTQVIGTGIETNFGTNVADGFFGGSQANVAAGATNATSTFTEYGGDGFFGGGASQVVTTVDQTPMTVVETRVVEPISTTVTTNYSTPVNYGNYNAYDDYSANLYDYTETPKPASCCNLKNICLGLLGLLLLGGLLGGLIGLLRFFLKGRNQQTIPSYLIPEEVPQYITPINPPPIVFPTPPTVVVNPPIVPDVVITPSPEIKPDVPIVTPLVMPGSTKVISSKITVLPYNVTTTTSTIRPPSIITLRPIKVNPIVVPSKPVLVSNPDVSITSQPDVSITTTQTNTLLGPQFTSRDIQQLLLIQKQYGTVDANLLAKLGISPAQYTTMIQTASQAGIIAPSQLSLLTISQTDLPVTTTTVAPLTTTDVQQLLLLAQQNGGINSSLLNQLNLSEAQYRTMIANANQSGLLSASDFAKLNLASTGSKLLNSVGKVSSKISGWFGKGSNIATNQIASNKYGINAIADAAAPIFDSADELVY